MTFTHSGADLTGVTLPDNSTWGYGYDRLGPVDPGTDPQLEDRHRCLRLRRARVARSPAPIAQRETFFPNQEQGWTNSGTSGSPAAATLLARPPAYTDPNGNVTDLRPDWNGQGLTDVAVDALGNVSHPDRTHNGLATVADRPIEPDQPVQLR